VKSKVALHINSIASSITVSLNLVSKTCNNENYYMKNNGVQDFYILHST